MSTCKSGRCGNHGSHLYGPPRPIEYVVLFKDKTYSEPMTVHEAQKLAAEVGGQARARYKQTAESE